MCEPTVDGNICRCKMGFEEMDNTIMCYDPGAYVEHFNVIFYDFIHCMSYTVYWILCDGNSYFILISEEILLQMLCEPKLLMMNAHVIIINTTQYIHSS